MQACSVGAMWCEDSFDSIHAPAFVWLGRNVFGWTFFAVKCCTHAPMYPCRSCGMALHPKLCASLPAWVATFATMWLRP